MPLGPARRREVIVQQPARQSSHLLVAGSVVSVSTLDSDDTNYVPVPSNRSGSTEITPAPSSLGEEVNGVVAPFPDLPLPSGGPPVPGGELNAPPPSTLLGSVGDHPATLDGDGYNVALDAYANLMRTCSPVNELFPS
ncbi:hypothetical protein K439DRAFT_1619875 [Ramaria rubella]|nr:hypothetical protein K439DRAFT_1619875 [Ramaria rubella]